MSNLAISRRRALVGALVSTAALAVPVAVQAAATHLPSPVPAMVAAHAAARAALDAANIAYEGPFAAYLAENEANPIMFDLPGFRSSMAQLCVTRTSPYAIEERYAFHYSLFHPKAGARLTPDGALHPDDVAAVDADRARDLAAALVNYEQAIVALDARHAALGVSAAEDRVNAACESLEAAWIALLSYVPRNSAELREKAAAVLAVAEADPPQLDEDHAAIFLRSLVGEVA